MGFSLEPLFCSQKAIFKTPYNPSFSIYFINYQLVIWSDKHCFNCNLGEGNRRILCGYMSFRHACLAAVSLQQLATLWPFPRKTAAYRQAMGHRG